MKNKKNLFVLFFIILLSNSHLLARSPKKMKAFTSDGCSLFPDGKMDFDGQLEWRHCCMAHDVEYWFGGTSK